MRFERELRKGRLLRRYKRFLADIELGGEIVVAHCPDPGAMTTCAEQGAPVWVSESDNPRRKLRYTWELVWAHGAMVCVNTSRANDVVAEALRAGALAPLGPFESLRREVTVGAGSRLDFLLEHAGRRCFVEVKSVTLTLGGGVSAFPDAVTARGTRHVEALIARVGAGDRAALLFCCSRDDTALVRPADHIDPTYGRALRRAAAAGVEVLAYRCEVSPRGVWLRERVPVELGAL